MKEFKVNEYITLKLEDDITNIYINDILFRQCKILLLNIPNDKDSKQIQSIDEAADKMGWSPFGQAIPNIRHKISPKTKFWVHCSNIQAWIENDYNTKILHHSISFPLLKKLVELGDPLAKMRFKEEVAERLERSTPQVLLFLIRERYLDVFTPEELESLILNIEFTLPSEKEYFKYVPSLFHDFIYGLGLSNQAAIILFEHLFKSFYGNLFVELKQILLQKSQIETDTILFKLTQGLLNTNLKRIKLYFNFLKREEKISLLNSSITNKCYEVIFELLTENPGLFNRLNEEQIRLLVRKALMTKKSSVISLLLDEGHLTHLSREEISEILANISDYGFSEKIVTKIENWFSWLERGYVRFRSCYIHKNDVEILQEVERTLDIKLIWTPFSLARSNYMFEIDDERRVFRLDIGYKLGKEIPNTLIEKIDTLKNLKVLRLPD